MGEMALDSWVRGHVVLLGDAAHADITPNMAEGASMALEDALVLARMLRRTVRRKSLCQRSASGGVPVSVGCNSERTAEIV